MANVRKHRRVTKEEIVDRFTYSVRGGDLVNKITPGTIAGCLSQDGYRRIIINGRMVAEHIAIYASHHGDYDYDSMQIDHINLDRIENLRLLTPKENSRHKVVHVNGKPNGVSYVSKRGKYAVYTYDRVNGRSKANYYGLYSTQKEAKRILDFVVSGECVYIIAASMNARTNG